MGVAKAVVMTHAPKVVPLVWESVKLDVVMDVLGLVSLIVPAIQNIRHTSNNIRLEVVPDTNKGL